MIIGSLQNPTMEKDSLSSLLIISIMGFAVSASNLMLNPIISVYARDYAGASMTEVALIVSAFSMISMFSRPLIGFYVTGKKILLMPILGLLLMAVSPLGMAFVSTPLSLILCRLIQGMGNALIWAPSMTLVALISSQGKRNENISKYTTITSLGMTLGPTIGTLSNTILGMRNTFLFASVMALAGLLSGIGLIQKRNSLFNDDNEVQESEPGFSSNNLRKILSNKTIRITFTSYIANCFVYSILVAYGTLYAKDTLKIDGNFIPLLFVGFNIIVLATRFLLGRLMHYVDKRMIIVISLVNSVCMMTILSLGNTVIFITAFALLGISHGLIYPIGAMLVAESVDSKNLGIANALYLTMWDIGNFIGPPISSQIIIASNNSIQPALLSSTLLPIIGLILNFVWREKPLSKQTEKAVVEKGKS